MAIDKAMKRRLRHWIWVLLSFCHLSFMPQAFASVSQTKNPTVVYAQSSGNPLRVIQINDSLYWKYNSPGNRGSYDENDYVEIFQFNAPNTVPTNPQLRVWWCFVNNTNPGVAPTAAKFEVWDDSASTWVNEVSIPLDGDCTNRDIQALPYINTASDSANFKVRLLAYHNSSDDIEVRINMILFRRGNVNYFARKAITTNVTTLKTSDNVRFAEYDVPATRAYDELDYFEYRNFGFSFPAGSVIGGTTSSGVTITFEALGVTNGPNEAKLEVCDEGDVTPCGDGVGAWQNHPLSPVPDGTERTYTIDAPLTYLTKPEEMADGAFKTRLLAWENKAGRRFISADLLQVKAKRRIIASDIAVFGPSTDTYYPGETNKLVLDFKIPDDDGAADTLNSLYVENAGTALDTTDILNLKLWEDGASSGWNGDETQIASFSWNGASSRFEATALSVAIPVGGKRLFVSADIAANPTDARTIQMRIPTNGITVASGYGGPTDAAVTNSSTQTIDGMVASQITNTGAPAVTVNANNTNVLAMDFTLQLDGARTSETLNKIRVQNTGTAVDGTDIAAVKAWKESGVTPGFQAAEDTLLGTLAWDATGSFWGNNTNFNLGYTANLRLYVTVDIASNPTDARTIQLKLKPGSGDTDAGIVVASGNDGPISGKGDVINPNVQTIDGMIAAQISKTDVAAATFYANETNKLVMNYVVPANGVTADTINILRVQNTGTAVDTSDIAAVKFWADNGDGTFDPATDTNLGTATWAGASSWWELSGLSQSTGTSGQRIFVSVDVAASPTAGRTIQMQIPVNGIQVASGNDGPIDATVTNANVQTIKEKLLIAWTDIAAASSCTDADDVEMLKLNLSSSSGTIVVNQIDITLTGTADPTADFGTNGIQLWQDNNGNNLIDPGTDTVLSSTNFDAAGNASFAGLTLSVGTGGVVLLIGYDTNANINLKTAGAKIAGASNFVVSNPADEDIDGSNLPANSTKSSFGTATVDVTGTDLAATQVNQGETDAEFLKLSMVANCAPATVTSVRVDRSGTGFDTDISQAKLYEDNGTTANVIDAGDTLIQTCTFSAGACTFSSLSLSIPTTARDFLVGYDISSTAQGGKMVGASMGNNTSYVTIQEAGGVASFTNPPIDSSNSYIGQTLTVLATDKAPSTVEIGSSNNLMLQLTLNATSGTMTLSDLKIDLSGTGVDADIAGAKLYDDVNDNGAYDPGTDTQLSTTKTFSAGTLTFNAINKNVVAGTAENLLILYDIASGATAGHTVGVRIVDRTYVTVSAGFVEDFSSIASSNAEIHHTLTVTGTDKATFTDVTKGQTNIVFEQLTLSASSGTFTVDTVKVDKLGTAADADISAVKLYRDVNTNGTLELGTDVQLSTTETFAAGTLTFASVNQSVTAGTPVNLLIVLDIAGTATAGNTIGVTLANNTYVTVNPSAGTTVSFAASPISSSIKTIKNPASLTASFIAPAAPITVNTNESFTVTMRVTNCSTCSAANSVAPQDPLTKNVVSGSPAVTKTAGPAPASANIGDGGTQDFSYTYRADAAGVLNFSGNASGTESNLGTSVTSNTATTPDVTINLQVSPLWEFSDSGVATGFQSVGTVRTDPNGNDAIFIGNDNGKLYKVKVADGSKMWAYNTGCASGIRALISWVQHKVFFGDECGTYHAVQDNGASYTLLWTISPSGGLPIRSGTVMWNVDHGAGAELTLFFGSNNNQLHSRLASNGSVPTGWADPNVGAAVSSTPAIIGDGYVWVATEGGTIRKVDIATGTIAQTISGFGAMTAPLVAVPQDLANPPAGAYLFIGSQNTNFYRINSVSASADWTFSPSSPVQAQAWEGGAWVVVRAWGMTGPVYVANNNGCLYAINVNNGTQVWKYPAGSSCLSAAAKTLPLTFVDAAGNIIFFGADDKKFYKVRDDGTSASLFAGWPYTGSGAFTGAPSTRSGKVIIGNTDFKLRAFPKD